MEYIDEVKIKTSHYIIGAVGVVTAITWKDSIKSVISSTLPKATAVKIGLINALIMTILLLLIIVIMPNTKNELPHETQLLMLEHKHDMMSKKINNIEQFI